MRSLIVLSLAVSLPFAAAYAQDCPPGLAKKNPACVPPGQAKKGVDRSELRAAQQIDRAAEELRRSIESTSTDATLEEIARQRARVNALADARDRDAALAQAQADLAAALDRMSTGEGAGGPVPVVLLDDLDLPALPVDEHYMVIDNTVIRVDAQQFELLDTIRRAAAVAVID